MKDIWICQTCKKEHEDFHKAQECHKPKFIHKCERCGYKTIFLGDANDHVRWHRNKDRENETN